MLVCAGREEIISYATPIGVGLIEASMGLTKLCLRERIEDIIFVGTAGSYSCDIPMLSLYVSIQATQIESGFLSEACYTPLDNYIIAEHQIVSRETLEKALVNSSNYITTDPNIAEQMWISEVDIILRRYTNKQKNGAVSLSAEERILFCVSHKNSKFLLVEFFVLQIIVMQMHTKIFYVITLPRKPSFKIL